MGYTTVWQKKISHIVWHAVVPSAVYPAGHSVEHGWHYVHVQDTLFGASSRLVARYIIVPAFAVLAHRMHGEGVTLVSGQE